MLNLHVSEVEIPATQTIRCFLIRIAPHRTLAVERKMLLFVNSNAEDTSSVFR